MIFKTKEQRRQTHCDLQLKYDINKLKLGWQKWFAWYPVKMKIEISPYYPDEERIVWLEFVERMWWRESIFSDFKYIYSRNRSSK